MTASKSVLKRLKAQTGIPHSADLEQRVGMYIDMLDASTGSRHAVSPFILADILRELRDKIVKLEGEVAELENDLDLADQHTIMLVEKLDAKEDECSKD